MVSFLFKNGDVSNCVASCLILVPKWTGKISWGECCILVGEWLNFLRRDDFDLIPFSNTGSAYNVLGFRSKETQFSEIGAKNKSIASC